MATPVGASKMMKVPTPGETVSQWLTSEVDKLKSGNPERGRDYWSFAVLNSMCREGGAYDLSKVFQNVKREDKVSALSPSEIKLLCEEDFFSMIDYIRDEQAMEIFKDTTVSLHRKMGFYFFNPTFARKIADEQRAVTEVAVDQNMQNKAIEFFKTANKYPPADGPRLKERLETCLIEKERMLFSEKETVKETQDKHAWRRVNNLYLVNGIAYPVTISFFEEIHRKLVIHRHLFSPPEEGYSLTFRTEGMELCNEKRPLFFCPGREVVQQMNYFIVWLNQEIEKCDHLKSCPIVVAGLAYQKFLTIQPFQDGNEETGDLLADLILRRYALLPAVLDRKSCKVAIHVESDQQITPTEAVEKMLSAIKKSYDVCLEVNKKT